MAKSHKQSKWCSRGSFLCKDPAHYRWNDEDELPDGVVLANSRFLPKCAIAPTGRNGIMTYEDALQYVVEQAMLAGGRLAYKALCIVAFNNPDYAEYQKSCLANYERIVNSPIPNRKLKRQV